MTKEITAFIQQHERTIAPLYKDYSVKFWELSTAASEQRERALIESKARYLEVYNNKQDFAQLRSWRPVAASLSDIEARQFKMIYDLYVPNQIDADVLHDIVERETEIETAFNTFRASFENGLASDNQLREVLKNEKNISRRQAAWEASKQVGQTVEQKLLELVKIRNREARKLGYVDYYAMMFELQELDEKWVFSLFDQLDELSEKPYIEMKAELDAVLKHKYGFSDGESYPWLYSDPFFQEFPAAGVTE